MIEHYQNEIENVAETECAQLDDLDPVESLGGPELPPGRIYNSF